MSRVPNWRVQSSFPSPLYFGCRHPFRLVAGPVENRHNTPDIPRRKRRSCGLPPRSRHRQSANRTGVSRVRRRRAILSNEGVGPAQGRCQRTGGITHHIGPGPIAGHAGRYVFRGSAKLTNPLQIARFIVQAEECIFAAGAGLALKCAGSVSGNVNTEFSMADGMRPGQTRGAVLANPLSAGRLCS